MARVADTVLLRGLRGLPKLVNAGKGFELAVKASFTGITILKLVALAGGLAGTLPLWTELALGDDGATLAGVVIAAAIAIRSVR